MDPIVRTVPLAFVWETLDPFLFCVHHNDAYPAGNELQGPVGPLSGRQLGQDFAGKDGWRMYHGETVPGFPSHPHRGFETVTVVRSGLVDHSDSMGATARYGDGDVQWLTAGKGIQHAEMFPLTRLDAPNPMDLFQIWLNLPRADKMAEPHFTMFWNDKIPRVTTADAAGRTTEITVVAGALADAQPLAPPPSSYASRTTSDIAIWIVRLAPGATWTVPAAAAGLNRMLYYFKGSSVTVAGRPIPETHAVQLTSDIATVVQAGPDETQLLLLQGRPIGEPVVQYGPFVMNTREEIQQAFSDYRRTEFGGWPWPSHDPVHARDAGRFAKMVDGRIERAG